MKQKNFSPAWRVLFFAALIFILFGCKKDTETPAITNTYATGAPASDNTTYQNVGTVSLPSSGGTLPEKVDLSPFCPIPGNQGTVQGSCVAWAVGYGLRSYHRKLAGELDFICSPAYIYNQIKLNNPTQHCNGGSYFETAFDLVINHGVCLENQMPYNSSDCDLQPNATQNQQALSNRFSSYKRLPNFELLTLKVLLQAGHPIVARIVPTDNLFSADANFVWNGGNNPSGGHAILIVGYDNIKRAVKFLNSWGTQWGDGGYGWISYDYLAVGITQAYVAYPAGSNQNDTKIIQLSGALNFGSVQVGNSSTLNMMIQNTGNTTLNVFNINVPQGYSVNWNHGSIAPNSSQTVQVTFSPSQSGSYNSMIAVISDATAGINGIDVKGIGTGGSSGNPILSLSTTSLAFGNVTVGSASTKNFTISNTGTASLIVSGIGLPSGYSVNWNSGTIAPNGSQIVQLTFTPTQAGSYSGNLTIFANQVSGSNVIALSGAGTVTTSRIIGLSGNLSFGSVQVGTTAYSTLTISNTGNSNLYVSSVNVPSGFSANWSGTISPASSQYVTVSFTPSYGGSFGGNVTVSSDATSGNSSISASGTGTSPTSRIIGLSGNLNFGSVQVGTTAYSTLTISNTGNTNLYVSSISLPSDFSGNWSGTIAPSSSQYVNVSFTPSYVGSFGGAITVSSDATSGTNTISASGTGYNAGPSYTSNPSVGAFTTCSGSTVYDFCGTFNPSNIMASVTSINGSQATFRMQKCSGTFSYSGSVYVKEDAVCGNVLGSDTYQVGWYYRDITISHNLTYSGQSKTFYVIIISNNPNNDRYYALPITITRN